MEFHESWNDPAFDHDICIITVKEGFNFDDPNVVSYPMLKSTDLVKVRKLKAKIKLKATKQFAEDIEKKK